ncbi:MAG: transglutaminase domain-containing protein [Oscillospiraceae bacterium]|jgi:transglutaminase-like putative cysteine protease|nr:transglutaminase domain-containing protein [Oscillospiraceae bacterium]
MKKNNPWPLLLIAATSFVLTRSVYCMLVIPLSPVVTLLSIAVLTAALAAIVRFRKRLLFALPFILFFLAALYPTGFYRWCYAVYSEYSAWMWNTVPHFRFELFTTFLVTLAVTLPVFIIIRCHSPTPILLFTGGILFFALENAGYQYPGGLFWLFMLCVLLQMTLYTEPKSESGQGSFTGARTLTVLPFCILIVWAAGAFAGSGADPLRFLRDLGHGWVQGWNSGSIGVFGSGAGYATDATNIGSELGGPFRPTGEVMLMLTFGASVRVPDYRAQTAPENWDAAGGGRLEVSYGATGGAAEDETTVVITEGGKKAYLILGDQRIPVSIQPGSTDTDGNFSVSPDQTMSISLLASGDAPYLRGGAGLTYDGRRWQSGGGAEDTDFTAQDILSTTAIDPLLSQRDWNGYRIRQMNYRGRKLYMPANLLAVAADRPFGWGPGDVYTLNESPPAGYEYRIVTADNPPERNAYLPPEPWEAYTQLPANLPQRVRNLARRLTVYEDDYYNALAIERHLIRYFTYNPDMLPTPAGEDFVDYFLNEQGEGHCVYFATAMTVLCRAAGIPARYVEGFAPTELTDEAGHFLYTDAVAHAWCEVYLGEELGWMLFEPTPGYNLREEPVWFPEPAVTRPSAPIPSLTMPSENIPSISPAVPVADQGQPFPWGALFLILSAPFPLVFCWWLLRRRRRRFVAMMRAVPYTAKQAHRVYLHIVWLEKHARLAPKPSETIWEFAERTEAAWPTAEHSSRRAADAYGKTCYGTAPLTREESEALRIHAEVLEKRQQVYLSRARLYLYRKILSLL